MLRTLALTAGLITACPAIADVIHVPGDFTTIQAAIDAAQPGDEIVVASGTYEETIDLQGKPLILRSSSGATFTAIDANGAGSVIRGAGTGAFIEGFAITGGSAFQGGGMFNQGGDPIVRQCRLGRVRRERMSVRPGPRRQRRSVRASGDPLVLGPLRLIDLQILLTACHGRECRSW